MAKHWPWGSQAEVEKSSVMFYWLLLIPALILFVNEDVKTHFFSSNYFHRASFDFSFCNLQN